MELGATSLEALPDTSSFGTPVTYTFDGKETSPYLEKVGINAVAGNKKAIVKVTAKIPETDVLAAFERTATFTIGDTVAVDTSKNSSNISSSSSANPITPPQAFTTTTAYQQSLKAGVSGKVLHIMSNRPAAIYVDIYDMLGNRVFQQLTIDAAKTPNIGLNGFPQGNYVVRIRQGSESLTLRWVNK